MDYKVAAPSRGLAWFQGGVRMLDRNPRGLLAVALGLVLLNQLPGLFMQSQQEAWLGLLVLLALFTPTLLGGLFTAIDAASEGQPVGLAQLFAGLRRPGVRGQLIVLGVVMLCVWALLAVAAYRIVGEDNLRTFQHLIETNAKPDSPEMQAIILPFLKVVGLAVAVLFVLMAAMYFAVPRVLFDGRNALAALGESLLACAANVLALFVYGVVLLAVAFVAAIVISIVFAFLHLLGNVGALLQQGLMIAFTVVWMLVSTSANYLAWREVFGRTETTSTQPPPRAGVVL